MSETDRPAHYGGDANPFEAIKIIEHYGLGFCLGNLIKYVLRAGKKDGEPSLKDLRKAAWYLQREIERLEETTRPIHQPPREALKLFVWKDVLNGGIAFALAHSEEESRRLIVAEDYTSARAKQEILTGERSIYDDELIPNTVAEALRAEPRVYEQTYGNFVRGGY